MRLAIVDELALSDRSPSELAARLGLGSNLLAHHLDVLEGVGLIERFVSSGDRRRKYVRLIDAAPAASARHRANLPRRMLFVCTHNSARSQLAVAVWQQRTGGDASSAGTNPAATVHPGAVAAAHRAGLRLDGAIPRRFVGAPRAAQVVTVCDRAHEELAHDATWWHWSIPDPVEEGSTAAFDAVVHHLHQRIDALEVAS